MKSLKDMHSAFSEGRIDLTVHAFGRMLSRNISKAEIMEAGSSAIEIEDYPDDKYYPSCLLLGFTSTLRPLHIQVSRVPIDGVRLITMYEPDESEWEPGFLQRRR